MARKRARVLLCFSTIANNEFWNEEIS